MTPRMFGLSVCALVTVFSLGLSGCGAPVLEGGIQRGERIEALGDAGTIRVIARPPEPGMSQVDIVQGFLEASANTTDLSVARQYLDAPAVTSWSPAAAISVVTGPLLVEPLMPGVWRVTSPLEGTVDAQGIWRVAPVGAQLEADFQMREVNGEWRIVAMPPGLILARSVAERALSTYAVHFLDATFRRLVPEIVVVSASEASIATVLIRRLLDGPASAMASAVTTAVPVGTRLALESVPVVDGVAQVSLSDEVLTANATERAALSAQILRTLAAVPGVSSARITVGSTPLEIPGVPVVQSLDRWARFDSTGSSRLQQVFGVRDGDVVATSVTREARPEPVTSSSLPVAEVAVSDATGRMAAVSADRTVLLTGRLDRTLEPVLSGRLLTSPVMTSGGVWVVDRGVGVVSWEGGRRSRVSALMQDGTEVSQAVERIDLAADRARVLVVVRQSGRSVAMVGHVERLADVERISGLRRIDRESGSVVSATWRGLDAVTLLMRDAAATTVLDVSLGITPVRSVTAPVDAVSVAAGPGRALVVGTQNGTRVQLLTETSGGWVPVADVSAPSYSR